MERHLLTAQPEGGLQARWDDFHRAINGLPNNVAPEIVRAAVEHHGLGGSRLADESAAAYVCTYMRVANSRSEAIHAHMMEDRDAYRQQQRRQQRRERHHEDADVAAARYGGRIVRIRDPIWWRAIHQGELPARLRRAPEWWVFADASHVKDKSGDTVTVHVHVRTEGHGDGMLTVSARVRGATSSFAERWATWVIAEQLWRHPPEVRLTIHIMRDNIPAMSMGGTKWMRLEPMWRQIDIAAWRQLRPHSVTDWYCPSQHTTKWTAPTDRVQAGADREAARGRLAAAARAIPGVNRQRHLRWVPPQLLCDHPRRPAFRKR